MQKKEKNNNIKKVSIAEAVAREIRKNIILHNYKPGQRLKERELCEEFNVSHTPIREAFRILQAENLVKMIPYVGVEVVRFDDKDIRDLYGARCIIESSTAELAAVRGTKTQREELYSIMEELVSIDYGNFKKSDEAESKFHLYIAKMSDNKELESITRSIYRRSQMLQIIVLSTKEGFNTLKKQHQQIAEAIINQDSAAARKHTEEHFDTAIYYASLCNQESTKV